MHRPLGRRGLGALVLLLVVLLMVSGLGTGGAAPASSSAPVGETALPVAAPSVVRVASAYVPGSGVTDLGPIGANSSLSVDVGLAPRDPSGLAAFVNSTEVAGTSSYRQFLSAAAADARFGASPTAVASAEAYFQSYGLATEVHPDGLLLSVTGPGPVVARAFGTTLHAYRDASGSTFISHPTVASLPAIAPWTGVLGLESDPSFEPEVRAGVPVAAEGPSASCPASSNVNGLNPCEVATAYDFPWINNGTNGSGQKIAVIDAYSSDENESTLLSDFELFSTQERLPTGGLSFFYPVPTTANLNASGTNPGWAGEDALDVEWAHASAPGSSVEMVFSPNPGSGLYFAVDWVVAGGRANVISMSWGEPEVGVFNAAITPCESACNASSDGSLAILDPVLELAAAEGISVFAASGDCGAADGTSGVAVNYPASDPFVTGVGATNLTIGTGGAYVAESGWGGNSTGARFPGCQNLGGSGGGYSVLPRPWWQTGSGTVPSRGRGVPDVAIVGGSGSSVLVYKGGKQVLGGDAGTSVGTPIWAGIVADADQARGSPLGWLNPGLYGILGNSTTYGRDFHSITSGSNGYSAHAGWNPVTGIGTPIVGELIPDLIAGMASSGTLTTYVHASPRFGQAPLTVRFALDVHGGSGTYALEGIAFGDGNSSAFVGGSAKHTFANAGVYSAQSYVVDSSGNLSASPPVVVVVGGGGALTVHLNATPTSAAVGENVSFLATVGGGSGPFLYNFSFGDGSLTVNTSASTVVHAYPAAGAFCAEVVVRNTASIPAGGASLRVPVAVGGATASSCGNPSEPLTIVANTSEGVRDAPADFPSLFTVSGGSPTPSGLTMQTGLVATSGRTSYPYTAACACTILRTAGNYTVEEWENDTVNGGATAIVNVTVAPPLNATFDASILSGPVPLAVSFSATVHGGYDATASATSWTFGNGRSAVGSTASTTYASAGEYVAIASLSDQGYGNASEAFLIDAEPAHASPVGLSGTVTPAVNVSSGETVLWNASVVNPTAATGGDVLAWNLGNGGSAFGPTANETYEAPVDVLADDELVASVSLETPHLATVVQVPIPLSGFFASEPGGFVPAVDALQLSEQVYPGVGLVPLLVTADAVVTGPGVANVSWLFGDGGSGRGPSATHVYYGAGDFTVEALGFDRFGDLAVREDGVVANAALSLTGCGASVRQGTVPYTVVLAPTATGGAGPPYTYLWTLPNGTNSSATNVSVTFDTPGTYVVVLVVRDSAGATYTFAWSITVTAAPPVSFLEVIVAGAGAGVALAAVFLWATRPRPRR